MRLKSILSSVFAGYLALGISLAIVWVAVVFWPFGGALNFLEDSTNAFYFLAFVALSLFLSTSLVMGAVSGWLWRGLPPAFDEILPHHLRVSLLFFAPLLFAPPAIMAAICFLPVFLFLMMRGFELGMRLRRARLGDEFLGRWSAGERE